MIIVDVETTGLDPQKLSVLSIGAVEFKYPSNHFYVELKPWEGSTEAPLQVVEALAINGMDLKELQKKGLTQSEGIEKFISWVQSFGGVSRELGGHNIWFDALCLKEMAKRSDVFHRWEFRHSYFDMYSVAYAKGLELGKEGYRGSREIYEFVGIPNEPNPHNALNGAIWETEALYRLIYGKSSGNMNFKEYPIPGYLTKVEVSQ